MTYLPPKPFEWNYCGTCGRALVVAFDGQSDKPHCHACRRFFYHNPVPATCCFVARSSGELLFARRAVDPCKGEWSLPGGFVELGETTEESALRELREETGLRATRAQLIGVSVSPSPAHGAVMVLGYIIPDWDGESDMAPDSDASELVFRHRDAWPPLAFSVHRELLARYVEHCGL